MDASQWARDRMAQMLGTPRSSRGYDSAEHAGEGAAPNPRKLIYQMLAMPTAGLTTRSEEFSAGRTPNARELLGTILPTPTACDTRSDRASDRTMARNSRPLSETSGALGLTGMAASPVSQRRALLLGLVEWMMGYPAGWILAVAPPKRPVPRFRRRATPPSRPMGTRSCRRSPKPSGER